jgi:hypothetical protein
VSFAAIQKAINSVRIQDRALSGSYNLESSGCLPRKVTDADPSALSLVL